MKESSGLGGNDSCGGRGNKARDSRKGEVACIGALTTMTWGGGSLQGRAGKGEGGGRCRRYPSHGPTALKKYKVGEKRRQKGYHTQKPTNNKKPQPGGDQKKKKKTEKKQNTQPPKNTHPPNTPPHKQPNPTHKKTQHTKKKKHPTKKQKKKTHPQPKPPGVACRRLSDQQEKKKEYIKWSSWKIGTPKRKKNPDTVHPDEKREWEGQGG